MQKKLFESASTKPASGAVSKFTASPVKRAQQSIDKTTTKPGLARSYKATPNARVPRKRKSQDCAAMGSQRLLQMPTLSKDCLSQSGTSRKHNQTANYAQVLRLFRGKN